MELILLEKINNLGDLGDRVTVRAGFGRNYLLPNKKAMPATSEAIAKFEEKRAELEKAQADTLVGAQRRAEALVALTINITAKAGDEGKLYGSVGTADIASAINTLGETLEKREIRLPSGALREVGEHDVNVHLHADVDITIKVNVIAEDKLANNSDAPVGG